ncbi:MAG: VOC family protein [Bacteroidota bacterium]
MKLTSITPNLMTDDMNATVAFYQTRGFGVQMSVPENPPYGWVMLGRDGIVLMFQSRENLAEDLPQVKAEKLGCSGLLYCNVEDVEAWHTLVSAETEIEVSLRKTFYGSTEFGFRDPNGYLIVLAERGS